MELLVSALNDEVQIVCDLMEKDDEKSMEIYEKCIINCYRLVKYLLVEYDYIDNEILSILGLDELEDDIELFKVLNKYC